MAPLRHLTEAREALALGNVGSALGKAWEASADAVYVRDPEELDEVGALAAQIAERAEGDEREEAERLVTYCAECSADIRAGVPHDSTLARLFRRS